MVNGFLRIQNDWLEQNWEIDVFYLRQGLILQ